MTRIIAVGTAIYPRPLRLHPTKLEISFACFIRMYFFCPQSLPSGMRIRNFKNHIYVCMCFVCAVSVCVLCRVFVWCVSCVCVCIVVCLYVYVVLCGVVFVCLCVVGMCVLVLVLCVCGGYV